MAVSQGANGAEIATAVATFLLFGGVLAGLYQVYDGRRTQAVEVVKDLARRWSDPDLTSIRIGISRLDPEQLEFSLKRAQKEQNEKLYEYVQYLDFFEELGVVARYGRVGIKAIDAFMGSTIRDGWDLWEPIVSRVFAGQLAAGVAVYENFAWLAHRLKRLKRRRDIRRAIWDRSRNILPVDPDEDWIAIQDPRG